MIKLTSTAVNTRKSFVFLSHAGRLKWTLNSVSTLSFDPESGSGTILLEVEETDSLNSHVEEVCVECGPLPVELEKPLAQKHVVRGSIVISIKGAEAIVSAYFPVMVERVPWLSAYAAEDGS